MFNIFRIILLFVVIIPTASCGVKGKLKTPEQIEKIEAKKAQEEAKKAQEEAAQKDDSEEQPKKKK